MRKRSHEGGTLVAVNDPDKQACCGNKERESADEHRSNKEVLRISETGQYEERREKGSNAGIVYNAHGRTKKWGLQIGNCDRDKVWQAADVYPGGSAWTID